MSERSTERVFVGLGANLGDGRATLSKAVDALAALPQTAVVVSSSFYASAPIDAPGPPFVNAVVELRTALSPQELLRAMQVIETDFGRQRPYHNAPRTLDLDLLLYGQRSIDLPELSLPHPRAHERGFVLVPLVEIAPDLAFPDLGPVQCLCQAARDQTVHRMD